MVNELLGSGDGMGYEGVLSGATPLNVPVVMDNAYGGWNTGIGVQNPSGSSAAVNVTYYDGNGVIIGSASDTIPAWGCKGWYQGGALRGQAGSAKIVSSGPIAVIVNETGPGGISISYNGTP